MGDLIALPLPQQTTGLFAREIVQGYVGPFAVVYGPLFRSAEMPLRWGVAVRNQVIQADRLICDGTYAPERGPWEQFEASMRDYAAIVLETLISAASQRPPADIA